MLQKGITEEIARSIPGGEAVYDALVALLARVGLDYSGGFAQVDGHRVHYLDYGPTDNGLPPVVLMHGAGAGAGNWYSQIPALRESRRVIALDGPMFGLSDLTSLDEHPTQYGSRFLAQFVTDLDLGPVDFVGLSFGGALVLTTALERPEMVRKLVLIDSAGFGRSIPFSWRLVHAPWLGAALFRPSRAIRDRVFERWEVKKPELPDREAYSLYAHAVRTRPGRSGAMRAGMKRFTSWLGQRSRFTDEQLRAVRTPTSVIWGEDDRVFPVRHGERAARLIPNASLDVIPDAGHVCFWDQSEIVNGVLRGFLNGD